MNNTEESLSVDTMKAISDAVVYELRLNMHPQRARRLKLLEARGLVKTYGMGKDHTVWELTPLGLACIGVTHFFNCIPKRA